MTTMRRPIAAVPCHACPFRKDVAIYLRRGRRIEIAEAILSGKTFFCHSTVDYESEEDEEGNAVPGVSQSSECAGAVKAALAAGTSTNHSRTVEALGMMNVEALASKGAECWNLTEWQDLAEGATGDNKLRDDDEEEGETCSVANAGCLAPAGYAMGGGVVYGTERTDGECAECGEPVCENCASDGGLCAYCDEWEDE